MSRTARWLSPVLVSLALAAQLAAQEKAGPPEAARLPQDWTHAMSWRSIGPASVGGRITALAVCESDPSTFYVGTASGGLLKTINNGVTFEHQFDREATVSIGDVAVAAGNPDIVWVGTGEANPRNSVSYGDGVYKSVDGGKTWKNMGLSRSFQVGQIAIHPENPDIVYVGALGRLYGPNEERGLFKTTDGGQTWQKILYVDDKTGVIDVQMRPGAPDTLLVATYERMRDGFDDNDPAVKIAPGSGLYRTTDGGATFEKLHQGLPTCKLGRIGLDYYRKNPDIVYAIVESELIGEPGELVGWSGLDSEDAEAGARITRVEEGGPAAAAEMKAGDIVVAAGGATVLSSQQLEEQLAQHRIGDVVELTFAREGQSHVAKLTLAKRPDPRDQDAEDAEGGESGEQRRRGRRQPSGPSFSSGLGGQRANAQKLQGPNGHEHGGVYRSEDGGTTWRRVNSLDPRPMYFSEIRVDPSDDRRVYVLGISAARSEDGGETLTSDASRGVHADQHALWIDPRDGRHMIVGTDGGLYVTWDRCAHWDHLNHLALGQFYHVAVSPDRDYWVYGGLQDNGTWGAPHRAARGEGTINEDWIRIGGGDGFMVAVDAADPAQIYYESQNGGMARTHLVTMESSRIRPRAPERTRYRFNWKTPFLLSHHNSRIYYCAGNRVFRSVDRGNDLKEISPEITLTDRGSATALAESPIDPDVLWVGTDDGALWATRDGGRTWTSFLEPAPDVSGAAAAGETVDVEASTQRGPSAPDEWRTPGEGAAFRELIPGPRWVSSIEASRFEKGRAYVVLDAHRSDDDNPYVLATDDFGATWRALSGELPGGSTRVLREDRENPDVLYLGTEFGAFVSIDRGQSWTKMNHSLPTVRVDDFAQHPSSGEVVAATHGRSLWILDVTPLRQMSAATLRAGVHLYAPNSVVQWQGMHRRFSSGARQFVGANPPEQAEIFYSLAKEVPEATLEVQDAAGKRIRGLEASTEKGLHRVTWDLRGDPPAEESRGRGRRGGFRRGAPLVGAGTYRVVLTVGDETRTQTLRVEADPGR